MKVSGAHVLHAPRERAWETLRDPAVLARTIPGCQQIDAVGADEYRARIRSRVAAMDGIYDVHITSSDPQPRVRASGSEPAGGDVGASCTLRVAASGDPGRVEATVVLRLDDDGDGNTQVRYDADAVVGGAIAGVGQRVLAGVTRRNAAAFFAAVDQYLAGEVPHGEAVTSEALAPPPDAPAAPPEHPGDGKVIYSPGSARATRPRHLLLAALAGSALTLLAVLAGRRRSSG